MVKSNFSVGIYCVLITFPVVSCLCTRILPIVYEGRYNFLLIVQEIITHNLRQYQVSSYDKSQDRLAIICVSDVLVKRIMDIQGTLSV